MKNRFEMEKCLQERIFLKKMTDTEISELLLKMACNIACRWKHGVTQKFRVPASCCKAVLSAGVAGRSISLRRSGDRVIYKHLE